MAPSKKAEPETVVLEPRFPIHAFGAREGKEGWPQIGPGPTEVTVQEGEYVVAEGLAQRPPVFFDLLNTEPAPEPVRELTTDDVDVSGNKPPAGE